MPEKLIPGKHRTMQSKVYIGFGILFFILLTVIAGLLFVGVNMLDRLNNLEADHVKKQQNPNDANRHTEIASAHFCLENPLMAEIPEQSPDTADYIIEGYKKQEELGNLSVTLVDDGLFRVDRDGIYSIMARITLIDDQKSVGIGIYIDDIACDKEVKSVSSHYDPETGVQYPTVVPLRVDCLDKRILKGQIITLKSYYDRQFLNAGTRESKAANWIRIRQTKY